MKTWLVAGIFLLAVPVQAQDKQFLKDVDGFTVKVSLAGDRNDVLSKESLRTWAELGLRRNGIKVGGEGAELTIAVTILELKLRAGENWEKRFGDRGYAYLVRADVADLVMTISSDYMGFAIIWKDAGYLGVCEGRNLVAEVKRLVEERIDALANDYLSVNPPEASSPQRLKGTR